jgi:integrase/recombinase XerD
MKSPANLALLLEGFFTRRLMAQRRASPHTIASYRDTFRLLLNFAEKRLKRPPSKLALEDIGTPLITSFLDELEKDRANTARSRNLRLAAIRSFFRYAALDAPEHSALSQRVLSARRSSCYWRPRYATRGSANATTPSSCWPCKPGCVCPN